MMIEAHKAIDKTTDISTNNVYVSDKTRCQQKKVYLVCVFLNGFYYSGLSPSRVKTCLFFICFFSRIFFFSIFILSILLLFRHGHLPQI